MACSEGSSSGGSSSDDAPTQSEQGSSTGGDDASSSAYPSSGPPGDPDQTIDKADVDAAVEQFGPIAEDALERTGVPGVAVSVVYDDEVVMSEGFGVRELGTDERVGADTVFQLASVSKPLGSAVVASIVGDEVIDWDEPITEVDSSFELADPWVSEHVTFADMYAHRSGLPEHAGDILEDLGGDRQEVLEALRYFPLSPFRATYAYTNAGLTEAGVSAAEAAGSSWTEASEARLYEPLGMNRSSSSFEDYMEYSDRAIPHVRDDRGDWIVAPQQRDAQAQSPAGGASSTVNDMAQFARMQLGAGTFEDKQIVDEEALLATRTPHVTSGPPRSPSARSSFYGLGWNVSYDDHGRTRLGHSGAFVMGAATTIAMVPNEDLAVVVLTNGQPVGLDLALAETFVDLASEGEVSRDWVELYGEVIEATIYPEPEVDYTDPPADPAPPADSDTYLGDYENDIYGTLQIAEGSDGDLQLTVGPDDSTFTFKHYDGDTFWFMPTGGASIAENALHATGVVFEVPDGSEQAESVTVQWLEGESPGEGVGTFERS
ncbi:MAG TPA: serine hydrolase [Ornithinimicrobium sp.]|nr:serine hydrolase [Ornithinimicrobium sp.]